jgi:RimJ/RimL family protein N-acetyltransferase
MKPSSAQLPSDPCALAAALPDVPRWVETRALLLSGAAVVRRSARADGAVVLDPALPFGCLVGCADAALLRDVLGGAEEDFELVVQYEAVDDARAALPGWTVAPATIHVPASPWQADCGAAPDVVVSAPPQQRWLELVPEAEEVRRYAALAEAIALRLVDGQVAAVCAAGDVTESLWDVGIDTIDGHRRQGHATAAFRALAAHMAAAGRQPVWGAEDDNVASMALAARLGFMPVDRLAILKAPQRS